MTHNQYDGIDRGRKLIVILGGLSAFGPLSMDMYLPGLPALTKELGASASTGQLTLTGCMLGIAAGQLFVGPLSDAMGRRRPLLAGLIGYILASLACAAAPSIWTLIVLRFIQGTLGGAGVVIARAIVRDVFSGAEAARVFALLMAVMGVAPVFAPLVGGQALAVTSWRGIFVLLAAIGIPLLVCHAWRGCPRRSRPSAATEAACAPPCTRSGGCCAIGASSCRPARSDWPPRCCSPTSPASSFVLEDVYGVSPQVFSLVFAVNSAGLVAMSQVGGQLVARFGPVTLLRVGLTGVALGSAATLVVTLAGAGLAPLLISLFVILSFNGMVFPNATAVSLAEQEGALGSASALLGVGQFGTGALIAPLVGLAGTHSAVPMGVLIGVCGIGALAVNLVFTRPVGRPAPAEG